MWIIECLTRFPVETEIWTGRRQDLSQVEREVSEAISHGKLGTTQVEVIENSSGWAYPSWWPRVSRALSEPLAIPSDFSKSEAKLRFIEAAMRSSCPGLGRPGLSTQNRNVLFSAKSLGLVGQAGVGLGRWKVARAGYRVLPTFWRSWAKIYGDQGPLPPGRCYRDAPGAGTHDFSPGSWTP